MHGKHMHHHGCGCGCGCDEYDGEDEDLTELERRVSELEKKVQGLKGE
jgi:hypothetical protein